MNGINFQRTYRLHGSYEQIKARAAHFLGRYLEDRSLMRFDDAQQSVTFTSERLIPVTSTRRPRVMLLFSNPHPHSIQEGMFLAPNTRGQESLFWPSMRESGWMTFPEDKPAPQRLAHICLNGEYGGPFDLLFTCYYAFPTNDPKHIRQIFGREYFDQVIAPQAMEEFGQAVRAEALAAVVTFNKEIFNLTAKERVERYTRRLMAGEVVRSEICASERTLPIYLTFPTGWRYHSDYRQFRKANLEAIKTAIQKEIY